MVKRKNLRSAKLVFSGSVLTAGEMLDSGGLEEGWGIEKVQSSLLFTYDPEAGELRPIPSCQWPHGTLRL